MGKARFLNVDLEVFSSKSLAALVRALESQGALALHSGRWRAGGYFATFELGGRATSADRTIRGLTQLVRELPRGPRALWDGASRRVLNIVIQAGRGSAPFSARLQKATLRGAVEIGAEIEVTVYGAEALQERSLAVRS